MKYRLILEPPQDLDTSNGTLDKYELTPGLSVPAYHEEGEYNSKVVDLFCNGIIVVRGSDNLTIKYCQLPMVMLVSHVASVLYTANFFNAYLICLYVINRVYEATLKRYFEIERCTDGYLVYIDGKYLDKISSQNPLTKSEVENIVSNMVEKLGNDSKFLINSIQVNKLNDINIKMYNVQSSLRDYYKRTKTQLLRYQGLTEKVKVLKNEVKEVTSRVATNMNFDQGVKVRPLGQHYLSIKKGSVNIVIDCKTGEIYDYTKLVDNKASLIIPNQENFQAYSAAMISYDLEGVVKYALKIAEQEAI